MSDIEFDSRGHFSGCYVSGCAATRCAEARAMRDYQRFLDSRYEKVERVMRVRKVAQR